MLRIVHTGCGAIEGIAAPEPEITVFRGIPFAAPPVGDLRWRAPQPVAAWAGTLAAHDFAPACPQPTPGDSNEFYDREWGTDSAIALDEARQVPAAELLAAAEALPVPPESGREGDWSMMVNWVPCVDGRFITDQYARTIARGEQNEVEILLGNTTGEFMETDADGTLLPAGEVGNLKLIAEWIRSGRKAPYYYRFDVAMPGDDAGAFHSSELWFSFGTLATCWRPFVG